MERAALGFSDTDETEVPAASDFLKPPSCHRLSLTSLPEPRPHVWAVLMQRWGCRLKPPSTAGRRTRLPQMWWRLEEGDVGQREEERIPSRGGFSSLRFPPESAVREMAHENSIKHMLGGRWPAREASRAREVPSWGERPGSLPRARLSEPGCGKSCVGAENQGPDLREGASLTAVLTRTGACVTQSGDRRGQAQGGAGWVRRPSLSRTPPAGSAGPRPGPSRWQVTNRPEEQLCVFRRKAGLDTVVGVMKPYILSTHLPELPREEFKNYGQNEN